MESTGFLFYFSVKERIIVQDNYQGGGVPQCSNSGLLALKRMSLLCDRDVLKQIHYAHIQSHISNGICVYGATERYNLDDILRVQKE